MVVRQHHESRAGGRRAHHFLGIGVNLCLHQAAIPSSASARVSTTIGRTGSSENADGQRVADMAAAENPAHVAGLRRRPQRAREQRLARGLVGEPKSPPRPCRRSIGRFRARAATSRVRYCLPPCGGGVSAEDGGGAQHFSRLVDRHEFELAAADGREDRGRRDSASRRPSRAAWSPSPRATSTKATLGAASRKARRYFAEVVMGGSRR